MEPAPDVDELRQWLYSNVGLPDEIVQGITERFNTAATSVKLCQVAAVSFLDHAWGQVSPQVQYEATLQMMALCKLGNPAWDVLFGGVMSAAAHKIRSMLSILAGDELCTVQFGHNSHELVLRLLSCAIDSQASSMLTVLTSDTEFYSLTRQLNRMAECSTVAVQVDVVNAEPAETFLCRLLACAAGEQPPDLSIHSPCAAVGEQILRGGDHSPSAAGEQLKRDRSPGPSPVQVDGDAGQSQCQPAAVGEKRTRYNMVYVSQITYLTQQTLLPDVGEAVKKLWSTCAGADGQAPFIVVDGYHAFGAVPTDLSEVAGMCYYVAGMLKHIGCGPNCAFMTAPTARPLRPLLTGWLADPTVLSPGSGGIGIGSQVGYDPVLALQGGTPGFMLPLLTFNALVNVWEKGTVADEAQWAWLGGVEEGFREERGAQGVRISVGTIHGHVLGLQARFLEGVERLHHPVVRLGALVNKARGEGGEGVQSHTLVFQCEGGAGEAAGVVGELRARGCLVDCRKQYLRVGFGFNHNVEDVDRLLEALADSCYA